MKECSLYNLENGKVRCGLCPHGCLIADGKSGICRVRINTGGRLVSAVYGRVSGSALDPIEKKPLYHFYPGARIFSIGTVGCNFSCAFCQNCEISQFDAATRAMSAGEVVAQALASGSLGVAYTYNEPTIWFEFVRDTAELAAQSGLKNVLVTNGFISGAAQERLSGLIDAVNVDIKSMDPDFYRRLCGGRLEPVLEAARRYRAFAHVEITHLVIPQENDDDANFEKLGKWVAANLGRSTPVHLSAYRPRYRLKRPPTDAATLERAFEIVSRYVDYVYLGNIDAQRGADTVCPECKNVLIRRTGYETEITGLAGAHCAGCDRTVDVVT